MTARESGVSLIGTLVAVFAHPDDETFICGGTLAKYAARGHHVVLVCATKGEMGRRMGVPPTATRESIPHVREEEMRTACAALSISQLHWLGLRDKTLEIQPFERLVDSVAEHLNHERPDVVVTFHETLGGHADHCTIGRAATVAFKRYALDNPNAKLYYVAWQAMASNPEEYGLEPQQMVEIDVFEHLQEKLYAFRAHRTQSQMNKWLWGSDTQSQAKLANREYFIQAMPPYRAGIGSLFG